MDEKKKKLYKQIQDYKKENLTRLIIEYPIKDGEKEQIKQAAAAAGESLQGYAKKAIRQRMEKEQASQDGQPAGNDLPND